MKNNAAVIDIIIGIVGLILAVLCGPIFGTALLIAAGGVICYRTKHVFIYPLISLAFNFIRSIVTVIQFRVNFGKLGDITNSIVEVDWLVDMFADMGVWAITTALSVVMVLGTAFVFLLMVICNVIVNHCSNKS